MTTLSPEQRAQRFRVAAVTRATGIPSATVHNWMCRKPPAILRTHVERQADAIGMHLEVDFTRVVAIGLVGQVAQLGFSPRQAAMMAAAFTDSSSYAEDGTFRMPGDLFPSGMTLLLCYPGASFGKVVRVEDETQFEALFESREGPAEACAVVWVNSVYQRIYRALFAPHNERPELRDSAPEAPPGGGAASGRPAALVGPAMAKAGK